MEIELLKELKEIIEEDGNIYILLSLLLNAVFLFPNTYMFINIFLNEMKQNEKFSIISLPYLTMLIYSLIKIDLNIDNLNENIKLK